MSRPVQSPAGFRRLKLLRSGGAKAVAAESLVLKQQLIISNRTRSRAPNLTSCDRFLIGLATLFVRDRRILKLGVVVRPATLLRFHQALVQRKYRLLFPRQVAIANPVPKVRQLNSLQLSLR